MRCAEKRNMPGEGEGEGEGKGEGEGEGEGEVEGRECLWNGFS